MQRRVIPLVSRVTPSSLPATRIGTKTAAGSCEPRLLHLQQLALLLRAVIVIRSQFSIFVTFPAALVLHTAAQEHRKQHQPTQPWCVTFSSRSHKSDLLRTTDTLDSVSFLECANQNSGASPQTRSTTRPHPSAGVQQYSHGQHAGVMGISFDGA